MAQTLGSTFDTSEPTVSDLMREIDSGALQLPDFQRPWVWEDSRIRALLASISLSFPIGALMLMRIDEHTQFAPKAVEGTAFASPLPKPERLILDGQQRLTSLYMALKSGRVVRTRREKDKREEVLLWYYLDMKKAIAEDADHEDRIDAIVAVPEDRKVKKNFNRDIELDLSTRRGECLAQMFPMRLMFDDVAADQWCEDYLEVHGYSKDVNQFLNAFRREIRDVFRQYRVPVIELLTGTRKEAVCQVFESVNTGGVSLTVFELLTATFAGSNFRLREDWERRSKVSGVRNADVKLKPLYHHDVLKAVLPEHYLQAVTLYATYNQHRATGVGTVAAKRKEMLSLKLEQYREHADVIHAGFLEAKRLLIREKVFTHANLPYATQLVPLATILAILGSEAESDAAKQKIARWYWCGVFGELYGSAVEGRFGYDVQEVPEWVRGGPEPRTITDAQFAPTRLLTMQSRLSAAYKGMMAPLMDRGSLDLKTGDPLHLTTYMHDDVDIHHLFPADYCIKQEIEKRLWNSVVNKAPLTARTNRSIGGRAPSEYLATIQKDLLPDRVDQILSSHGIDPVPFRANDFNGFFQRRVGVLLDLIAKAMGKEVVGRDSEETRRAFGGGGLVECHAPTGAQLAITRFSCSHLPSPFPRNP
jgi:hypothetical protein